MKIRWRLRMAAAQREVWTGTQSQRLPAERAGLRLSSASVSALFTKEPSRVKISTLIALCTALGCAPNDPDEQRALFRRWTLGPDVHPHEALFGLLALLHGASSKEIRTLTVEDIDHQARTIRLGDRPPAVPMDPASWAAVQRCLAHRATNGPGTRRSW